MKKRFLAMLMSVVLAAEVFAPCKLDTRAAGEDAAEKVYAEEEDDCGITPEESVCSGEEQQVTDEADFVWEGTVITGYNGSSKDVVIPAKCTGIGINAFKGKAISTLDFEENSKCEKINVFAFEESGLTSVTIPESMKNVEYGAFKNCQSLKTLTVKSTQLVNFSHAEQPSLKGCVLETVNLPEGMKKVPDNMFASCGFSNAENVKEMLPSTLTELGEGAFRNAKGFNEINLPEGLEKIGEGAFEETELESVTIPANVTFIGYKAFRNCEALKTLKVLSVKLTDDSHSEVPSFEGCTFDKVELPEGMTLIPAYMFKACSFNEAANVKDIIPATVTRIGDGAFREAEGVTEICLPEGLETIGNFAFYATALSSVTIPSKVSEVGYSAFRNCASLTKVSIESTVLKTLGHSAEPAFGGCTINQLELAAGLTQLPEAAFSYVTFAEGTKIVLPASLKKICVNAFNNSKNISSVTFPVGIEEIQANAFMGCEGIAEVVYDGTEEGWQAVTIADGNDAIKNPTKFNGQSGSESPLGPEEADLSQYTAGEEVIVAKSINLKKFPFAGIKGIKKFVVTAGDTASVKLKGSKLTVLADGTVTIQALGKKDEILGEKELTFIVPELTITGTQEINRRGTLDLNAFIKSTVKPASWKSSGKKIAEVSEDGLLTIKKSGSVKITVKFPSQKGINEKSLSFKITIKMPQFKKSTYKVKSGKTVKTAVKNVSGDVSYRVEDPTLASVDANGVVTGIAKGETRLIMTVNEIEYYTNLKVK